MRYTLFITSVLLLCSCAGRQNQSSSDDSAAQAAYFSIGQTADGQQFAVSVSPYGDAPDTLFLNGPLHSVICMSSTSVAGFCAIGAGNVVSGISGKDYISDESIRARADEIAEVGYDAALDYETILNLHPDLVLAYSTSAVIPDYVTKLRASGIRVMMIYDYLESHPLARAEYIRLYGCLAGKQAAADSLFDEISKRYNSIANQAAEATTRPAVLVNVPYADVWYVPGQDNYFSTLINDAGGQVLGSRPGTESSTISLEEALSLASEADIWLNPGSNTTREEIASIHPLIASFPVLKNGRVFNNIKRTTTNGGNDFWESGSVRPDLVLSDLFKIIHPELAAPDDSLVYYIEVK